MHVPEDTLEEYYILPTFLKTYSDFESITELASIELDSVTLSPYITTEFLFHSNKDLDIYSTLKFNVTPKISGIDAAFVFKRYLSENAAFRENAYLQLYKQHQHTIKEIDASYKSLDSLLLRVGKIYLVKYNLSESSDSLDSLDLKEKTYELSSIQTETILNLFSNPTEQLIPYRTMCFIPSYGLRLYDSNNQNIGYFELVTDGCAGYSFSIKDSNGLYHSEDFEFNHALDALYKIIQEYE